LRGNVLAADIAATLACAATFEQIMRKKTHMRANVLGINSLQGRNGCWGKVRRCRVDGLTCRLGNREGNRERDTRSQTKSQETLSHSEELLRVEMKRYSTGGSGIVLRLVLGLIRPELHF
jgi:hypothetical protein